MPRLALFLMLLLAVVTPAPAQTPLREAIAARLARDVPVAADLRIANDGALEDAVDALEAWWRRLEDGLSVAA